MYAGSLKKPANLANPACPVKSDLSFVSPGSKIFSLTLAKQPSFCHHAAKVHKAILFKYRIVRAKIANPS